MWLVIGYRYFAKSLSYWQYMNTGALDCITLSSSASFDQVFQKFKIYSRSHFPFIFRMTIREDQSNFYNETKYFYHNHNKDFHLKKMLAQQRLPVHMEYLQPNLTVSNNHSCSSFCCSESIFTLTNWTNVGVLKILNLGCIL